MMRFSEADLARGDEQYDALREGGHTKDCIKWRVYHLPCNCGARRAEMKTKLSVWLDNFDKTDHDAVMVAIRKIVVPEIVKLEAENRWMRREIGRVSRALFADIKGEYLAKEGDLHAIGQSVEGLCETIAEMVKERLKFEKLAQFLKETFL